MTVSNETEMRLVSNRAGWFVQSKEVYVDAHGYREEWINRFGPTDEQSASCEFKRATLEGFERLPWDAELLTLEGAFKIHAAPTPQRPPWDLSEVTAHAHITEAA